MKSQKIWVVSIIIVIVIVLLGAIYFVKPKSKTLNQSATTHYQGPSGPPGQGFHGPTGPHP